MLVHTLALLTNFQNYYKLHPITKTLALLYSFIIYLPSSYSWYYENEGECNHAKGDQKADLEDVLCYGSLVLPVESRQWLVTKRIAHLSLQPYKTERNAKYLNSKNSFLLSGLLSLSTYSCSSVIVPARAVGLTRCYLCVKVPFISMLKGSDPCIKIEPEP